MEICSIAYYKYEKELVFIPQVYVLREEWLADGNYAVYYIDKDAIRPDEAKTLILSPEQKESLVLIGAENEQKTTNI